MLVWVVVLAVTVLSLVEAVAIVALAREVGVLGKRLPPAPALSDSDGPPLDKPLPEGWVFPTHGKGSLPLHGHSELPRLLVFLSPRCVTCVQVLRELPAVCRDWPGFVVLPIVDGTERELSDLRSLAAYTGPLYRDDRHTVMRNLDIIGTPRALAISTDGVVIASGIVNTREMIGSLLQGNIRRRSDRIAVPAVSDPAST